MALFDTEFRHTETVPHRYVPHGLSISNVFAWNDTTGVRDTFETRYLFTRRFWHPARRLRHGNYTIATVEWNLTTNSPATFVVSLQSADAVFRLNTVLTNEDLLKALRLYCRDAAQPAQREHYLVFFVLLRDRPSAQPQDRSHLVFVYRLDQVD